MHSGTVAAALAANAEIFQWRWGDATNLGIMYKTSISAGANVAATAAALGNLVMVAARGWSANGTGGTAAVVTGNISKLRTSMGTSLLSDARICTTAALGAGTKTIDHATTNMGAVSFGIGTGAITTALDLTFLPDTKLFDADGEGMHPLVCAQNEGFIIRNGTIIFPATMTWTYSVNVVCGEAATF